MRVVRSAGGVFSALVAATLVALTWTTTSALAATALIVGGIGSPVFSDVVMSQALGGKFTGIDPSSQTPWQREAVLWPAQVAPLWGFLPLGLSVSVGTDQLYAAILATPGAKTVVGVSAGSLVADEVARRLTDDPAAPSKEELKFVVIADGSQQIQTPGSQFTDLFYTLSGYTYRQPPETPYDLTVVTSEYDGYADAPDKWGNLIADTNAIAGMVVRHVPTYFADLSTVPDENITVTTNTKGGVTTRYLIPAEQLPLVTVFPALAPAESWLKEMVDAAYSRNDAVASSAALAQTAATEVHTLTTTAGSGVDALTQPNHASAPGEEPHLNPTEGVAIQVPANPADTRTNAIAQAPTHTKPELTDAAQARASAADTGANETAPATTHANRELTDAAQARANQINTRANATPRTHTNQRQSDRGKPAPNGATDLTNGNKVTPGTHGLNPSRSGRSSLNSVREAAKSSVRDVDDAVVGQTGAGSRDTGTAKTSRGSGHGTNSGNEQAAE